MGEVIGLLLLLPLVGIADWIKFIKRLPPREQELTKASHGMAFLVIPVVTAAGLFGWQVVGSFPQAVWADGGNDPWLWGPALIYAATALFGLSWLIIGGARCPGPFDARLFTRAFVKTGFGVMAWVISFGDILPKDWIAAGFLEVASIPVGLWCMITGLTKILLLMKRPSPAFPMVAANIAANEFNWDDPPPRKRWWRR